MARIIPFLLWKIKFMFKTTNQYKIMNCTVILSILSEKPPISGASFMISVLESTECRVRRVEKASKMYLTSETSMDAA